MTGASATSALITTSAVSHLRPRCSLAFLTAAVWACALPPGSAPVPCARGLDPVLDAGRVLNKFWTSFRTARGRRTPSLDSSFPTVPPSPWTSVSRNTDTADLCSLIHSAFPRAYNIHNPLNWSQQAPRPLPHLHPGRGDRRWKPGPLEAHFCIPFAIPRRVVPLPSADERRLEDVAGHLSELLLTRLVGTLNQTFERSRLSVVAAGLGVGVMGPGNGHDQAIEPINQYAINLETMIRDEEVEALTIANTPFGKELAAKRAVARAAHAEKWEATISNARKLPR